MSREQDDSEGAANMTGDVIVKQQTHEILNPDGTVTTTTTITKSKSITSFEDVQFECGGDCSIIRPAYCISLPGILRILEIICGFIIVGCVTGPMGSGPFSGVLGGQTYVLVITCLCVIITFVLLILLFFGYHGTLDRRAPWRKIDFFYSVTALVLFFIAGVVESWYAGGSWRGNYCNLKFPNDIRPLACTSLDAWIAAAIFCFINMILYGLSAYCSLQRSYYVPKHKYDVEENNAPSNNIPLVAS